LRPRWTLRGEVLDRFVANWRRSYSTSTSYLAAGLLAERLPLLGFRLEERQPPGGGVTVLACVADIRTDRQLYGRNDE
jgi:hypothetical protein